MNRWWNRALAGIVAWGWLGSAFAAAQFPLGGYSPPQVGPPAFPPILNLNRSGTNPAINYFGLVRPQQQAMQQLANLQYQQSLLAGAAGTLGVVAPDQAVPLSTTGHPVRYFDYARYFPLGGLPGAIGTGTGAAPATGVGFGAPSVRTGITPGFGVVIR
jgi:hypothetical protein